MTLRADVLGSIVWLTSSLAVPAGEQPAAQLESPATVAAKAKQALAQIEGELKFVGLKEPVEVLRDRWGIAHIYAKNS